MTTHCGYVALIGRPNVGKSTLLNQLLGKKLSITSPKPQTTRHRLLGIKTKTDIQIVYVDTPGLDYSEKRILERLMSKTVMNAILDVDVVIFVVDATSWQDSDEEVIKLLKQAKTPVIIAFNKIDKLKTKEELLPRLKYLNENVKAQAIVPIVAISGKYLDRLEQELVKFLPEGPYLFPKEDSTDRDVQFLLSEYVREKLFIYSHQELPYSTAVLIEKFSLEKNVYHVSALILVEREGQKAIFIGKKGENLKRIGKAARLDMEKLLGKKVFLQLWVKVKSDWANDMSTLKLMGHYDL